MMQSFSVTCFNWFRLSVLNALIDLVFLNSLSNEVCVEHLDMKSFLCKTGLYICYIDVCYFLFKFQHYKILNWPVIFVGMLLWNFMTMSMPSDFTPHMSYSKRI